MNFFIPISVGNKFYTKSSLSRTLEAYVSNTDTALICVCDSLRRTYYQIALGQSSISKAEQQSEETYRFALNTVHSLEFKIDRRLSVSVEMMSTLQSAKKYKELKTKLEAVINNCVTIETNLEKFASEWLRKVGVRLSKKKLLEEKKYILEETVLSLYCTEILGYSRELYILGDDLFVNWLYHRRPDFLREEVFDGKPLIRSFSSLAFVRGDTSWDKPTHSGGLGSTCS